MAAVHDINMMGDGRFNVALVLVNDEHQDALVMQMYVASGSVAKTGAVLAD